MSEDILVFGTELFERLFPNKNAIIDENSPESDIEETTTDFEKIIEIAMKPKSKVTKNLTFQEMYSTFRKNGIEMDMLVKFKKALLSVVPTSVQSERIFSLCGSILTKKRNRISPNLLHALVLINAFQKIA